MDASQRFRFLLNRDFVALLRADGFKGSGNDFRRIKDDRIDVVNIQGSQSGGKCCINTAVHFSFLPPMGGDQGLDAKKLKEYECAFRSRLRDRNESEQWWVYGETDGEAEASVASLCDVYRRKGSEFVRRFEPFPDVFKRVTPGSIDAGDLSMVPGRMTLVFAAVTLARIMRHLGQIEKCKEFADVGLRHIGSATGLKLELERLKNPS